MDQGGQKCKFEFKKEKEEDEIQKLNTDIYSVMDAI